MKRMIFVWLMGLIGLMGLVGCKTQYVPVETVHKEYHNHTDSVKQIDSIFHEKETIIRELDSAAMAEYGIRLEGMQKAWLVQTKELERRLKELQEQKTDTVVKVDSVQVIVPVEKELTKWQSFCCDYGKMMLGGTVIGILLVILLVVAKINGWKWPF